MFQLQKKVFGNVMAMEIIGGTPTSSELEKKLESELDLLLKNLIGKSKEDLKKMQGEQCDHEKLMNSKPGSMAISQEKIRLFTIFSQKYILRIKQMLETK